MWRKFQISCVLLAWLLATGSQWDLTQVFAWGRMFTGYAHTMTLTNALCETFDPAKPCPICQLVQAAKQQQDSPATPDAKVPGKMLIIFQPAAVIVFAAPAVAPWLHHESDIQSTGRGAPPVPPPRAA